VDVPHDIDMDALEEEFSLLEREMAIDVDIKEIEVLEL
jgi:hypothetical protein